MPSRLRPKERCPLHGRRDCCGRAEFSQYQQPKHARKGIWIPVRPGLWRSEDGREKCGPMELRRRKNALIKLNPVCEVCGQTFTDYDEIDLGHRESKGIGGGKRNDAMSNLCLLHRSSNQAMGSMSIADYIALGGKC